MSNTIRKRTHLHAAWVLKKYGRIVVPVYDQSKGELYTEKFAIGTLGEQAAVIADKKILIAISYKIEETENKAIKEIEDAIDAI